MDASTAERFLCGLAGELAPDMFKTELTISASGWPELIIVNRSAGRLSERVRVRNGAFQWSWEQAIAPVGEHILAARRIARVLATVEG